VTPTTNQQWVQLLRRAVADTTPVASEQLLLMRDLEGRSLRPRNAPTGIVPREAAVLLLCYPENNDLLLLLTRRTDALPNHAGQISLPGGAADPEDADVVATALREGHEEIGVDGAALEVLGTLEPVYIPPSNFRVTPVVALASRPPVLVVSPDEVAEVLSVSLATLLAPATVVTEEWDYRGIRMMVPFYALQGHKVWGATALVLSELVARLRRVLGVKL
jgi:8-oxo-dGTP pyrophosphatase MutT (NUDIX family)